MKEDARKRISERIFHTEPNLIVYFRIRIEWTKFYPESNEIENRIVETKLLINNLIIEFNIVRQNTLVWLE